MTSQPRKETNSRVISEDYSDIDIDEHEVDSVFSSSDDKKYIYYYNYLFLLLLMRSSTRFFNIKSHQFGTQVQII